MNDDKIVSVVIPTKNEAANIGNCLAAFDSFRDQVELIVVDNSSPDRTREIAAEKGAKVFVQGPERCAQRNRGWREASGEWVLFLDADMTMPEETIKEILRIVVVDSCSGRKEDNLHSTTTTLDYNYNSPQAYYIPEVRDGVGLRAKARNFERGFYDGTCIDGLRLIRREALERIGGYDEELVACEDWDLDRRLLCGGQGTDRPTGGRAGILKGHLVHHEALVPLGKLLKKKAYYSTSVGRYRAKWHEDEIIRKQFGLWYRYVGVFTENGKWKRLVAHPILAAVMMFERVAIGVVYLVNR